MRLPKRALPACDVTLSCLLLFSACGDFFTTSVASALTRDIDYSSLSLGQLIKLAKTRGQTNSDVAKAILEALADYEDELAGLSVEEKEAILKVEINAVFPLDLLLDLTKGIIHDDISSILEDAWNIASSGVDTTAVSVILQDEETLANVPEDILISASLALLTEVTGENINDIIEAIESESTSNLSDDNLQDIAKIIINVMAALEKRED